MTAKREGEGGERKAGETLTSGHSQSHSHRAPVWPVCFLETVLMESHLPVPLIHSVLSGTFD